MSEPTHEEVTAELGADLEALVLEAVEGGRHQAIAFSVAVVLALEVAELSGLDVEPETLGEHRRVAAEAHPELVDVDLLVARSRVAIVEIDEIDLGVRLDVGPPARIDEEGQDGELEVLPLVHRFEEALGGAGRQKPRREGERTGKAQALAVAIVRLALEAEARAKGVGVRRRRVRRLRILRGWRLDGSRLRCLRRLRRLLRRRRTAGQEGHPGNQSYCIDPSRRSLVHLEAPPGQAARDHSV